eukprot:9459437-Pyramimonas_sp.AAC.1
MGMCRNVSECVPPAPRGRLAPPAAAQRVQQHRAVRSDIGRSSEAASGVISHGAQACSRHHRPFANFCGALKWRGGVCYHRAVVSTDA